MIDTRFPDFYIVGNPKSGTTALWEMLRRHPDIFMPQAKEPGFFADELVARIPSVITTEDDYLALFALAPPGNVVGEASANYLWSRSAARRIAKVRPDARIIALIREPAAYLRSRHVMYLRDKAETEQDLRKAMELEPERRAGRRLPPDCRVPEALFYSDLTRYVEQLRRFTDQFSRDQVLVLTYEEFRRANTATVKEILRFLGVSDSVALPSIEANPSYRVRSWHGQKVLKMIDQGRGAAIKKVIMPVTTQRMRRRALYYIRDHLVHGKPRPADERLMLELRHRYRSEVVNLGEFLGRDLVKEWGYDQL